MDGEPAAAVKIGLIVKLLEDLGIKHSDDKIVGLIGIRYHAEQSRPGFAVPVYADSKLFQCKVIP